MPPMRLLESEVVFGCMSCVVSCTSYVAQGGGDAPFLLFFLEKQYHTHKQRKLPTAGLKQGLFVFKEEFVVDLIQFRAVEDAVADDGIPLDPGIKLGIGGLLEQPLGLLQGAPQSDTKAQQPVPRGIPPAGKHLMKIDLAHAGFPRKGSFRQRFLLVKLGKKLCNARVGKERLIFPDVLINTRLTHQLLAQVAG